MSERLKRDSLEYHALPVPGKISIELTKPAETMRHLAMAYSPGVAEPCSQIAHDPSLAYRYTGKGNSVAVISNGTAVLGLGNLGALASKPVMEGKALLFKRFADINAIDVLVDTQDVDTFVNTVRAISCTYGGINLEDIKAPECFEIERRLQACCDIPVFHDDQHGTAIVTAAGLVNALEVQEKSLEDVTVVCLGAGAAAVACMNLLLEMGADPSRMMMLDRQGVIHSKRDNLSEQKALFAVDTDKRTLDDAMKGADVLIGLSGPDLVSADMVRSMAPRPIIFACSNPNPEINRELALATRDDLIMATGRSDYPNQVNNVLGFPFIFRGALDVRASTINEAMKIATVKALAQLAREPVPESVLDAYSVVELEFGPYYILPKPMDPRLMPIIAPAVAKAAIESGVARAPLDEDYEEQLWGGVGFGADRNWR
ncbi:NADP-dependent malic enzyme [Luminiphilus syltensis NOR5-1B]|uniref:NADP-dependent malic enzyme n=1 Tax=Luminiphilus syltensis NOR5-1B TaxID=565045 RepID=B8KUT2_9GAMM|nr:malic enzyme-like NAD(P)-binding protein [Luminiphilus syltensis]EED34751.1 NADP-dependent malic enzyme [Luminiphilus syltensis NOR5-1B]